MFVFPGMLVSAAEKAGIEVPENPEDFDKNKYIRFYIFCEAQLGRSMPYSGVHWDNAKIIAEIPEEKLKVVTMSDLLGLGFK